MNEFGSALLLEQYAPRYRYRVPKGDKSVGYFFSFMEKLKEKLDIDEYSASQTTLEQIFNGFAREDEKEVIQREFTKDSLAVSKYPTSNHMEDVSDNSRSNRKFLPYSISFN